MYDVKPDRVGWTVYDAGSGRAALLDGVTLQELDHAEADELAGLLNRAVYGPRRKPSSVRPGAALGGPAGCGAGTGPPVNAGADAPSGPSRVQARR
jgi:hypothetical protein